MKKVFKENERPPIQREWSPALQELLERNWHPDLQMRLTMDEFQAMLRLELISLRQGDDSGLRASELRRRRSTFVFEMPTKLDFSSNNSFFSRSGSAKKLGSRESSGRRFYSRESSQGDLQA